MSPKRKSVEKKVKDKKTIIPKATKKKPALKTPPAKQTICDSKNTRISTLRLRGRTVLPKEAKELVNKNVEDSIDTKKSQSSPKKERRKKSIKVNVELANEVARYQLAKSLPTIEIRIPSLNAPEMGKKLQNEPYISTGTGIITIRRNKLTEQAPSLEKVKEITKTSVIAPKRTRKKKERSSCHCTQSDATHSPSESSRLTNATVSKKVKNKIIDSCNSDPQVVPVKKKRVAKKINASCGKNADAKKVDVKIDTQKLNLPKIGSDLEINVLEDAANNIEVLPANLSLGVGNLNSSPIKNQNKTVKRHVKRRKLDLPRVGSDLEINILEGAANNIGSPSILTANLSLGVENSDSSRIPIKNQSKPVKKHVQRRKLNLPKVGSDLEINILEGAANNIASPSILPANLSLGVDNSDSSPIKNQSKTVKKPVQRKKLNLSKKYPNGVIKNNVTSVDAKEPEFLDGLDTLSWTKQISSSDTSCTSVCSSKFVCSDIQLLKLGQACQGFVKVDKISEISSIISSPTYNRDNTAKFPVNTKKTVSSSCSSNSRADLQDRGSYSDDFKKVNSTLSRFINSYDMEVMDWLGTDHGENKSIRDNMFYNCFKVESQVFNILKNIENIWAGKDTNVHGTNDVHSPVGIGDIQADDKEISALNHDDVNNHNNTGDDDEDVLSIFAESFKSSRTSIISKMPEYEEYIAQPIANVSNIPKATYVPTKIVNNIDEQIKTNSVCEKHNADSTSVREMDRYEKTPMLRDKVESLNNIMSPPMKISHYIPTNKPPQRKFSMVYKGVCFYNLISNCKRFNCTYPHENLEVVDVKNNMSCLPNDMFAQEFTLTKNYPPLRQKFIVAFIEECIKRKLTELLLEMCTDYLRGSKAISEPIFRKTYVLEITMLHLNEVPLSDYEYLLENEIFQETTLCDRFMKAIAFAQNFQQFKQLFVNLVDYMIKVRRKIELKVAKHIAERLCILPCEDVLINAFFNVIKNTDVEIINCQFVGRLEKRLQIESVKLYEYFLCVKNDVLKKKYGACTSVSSEEKHSRTSPDTTNLDNSVITKPIWTHKNIEQRERVVAGDNMKSFTISQTPIRGYYNSWSPQNSFHEERYDRPRHEFTVPHYYNWRSRNGRPGPRSHGAPGGYKGGRPHYRRHYQPSDSYVRRPHPNGRVAQKTFNNHWKNRKGEHYNQNNHYYS